MKFYNPVDKDGRTVLCATKAEADKISKNYDTIEVKTDQGSLMAFAQEALDATHQLKLELEMAKADASSTTTSTRPVLPLSAPTPSTPTPAKTANEIEDFILHIASVAQIENLFACLGNRFAELAKQS